MHPLFYNIIAFVSVGALGMAIAGKKADKKIRSERWLKFFSYILITGIVIISIWYKFFFEVAIVIAGISVFELLSNSLRQHVKRSYFAVSFLLLIVVISGFLLFSKEFNPSLYLFIYFQVLIFDAFCQVTGQLWGKRVLMPSVSPAKTVEGLIGGWISCILAAVLSLTWIDLPIVTAMLFGFITGLASFSGDVLASFYKRKLGIKDYSNWLPGQGGFLDRFDSFLVAGFVYHILFVLIFKDRFSEFINLIAG